MDDISFGSPQAAEQGSGLQPMIDVGASLPSRQHPGGIRALMAAKKQRVKEYDARQNAIPATVAKRPTPASEDQPNKRLQGDRVMDLGECPNAAVEPYSFNFIPKDVRFHPCFARVTFPDARGTIKFGSAFGQSKDTVAKVKVIPGRWGNPSVTLKMALNKGSLKDDLAIDEDKVSNLQMVWQPYIETRDSYQVQEFTYGLVSESEHLKHPDVEEQAKQAGKDGSHLIHVRMVTNGLRITSPYEAEYWRLLIRKGDVAARRMAICAGFMSQAEKDANMTVEFWFMSKVGTSRWVSLIGDSFKRCVDERLPRHPQHCQGPDRIPVFEDKQGKATPEPTPFGPGDKVAKLVREGWSIMEAMDKVFGGVTDDDKELQDKPESAIKEAGSVQSLKPMHLRLGDKAKGDMSEIAQTPQRMPVSPKTTQGGSSLESTPEQEEERLKQLEGRMEALMEEGWSLDAAFDETFGKQEKAKKPPKPGQKSIDYEAQGSKPPKARVAADTRTADPDP